MCGRGRGSTARLRSLLSRHRPAISVFVLAFIGNERTSSYIARQAEHAAPHDRHRRREAIHGRPHRRRARRLAEPRAARARGRRARPALRLRAPGPRRARARAGRTRGCCSARCSAPALPASTSPIRASRWSSSTSTSSPPSPRTLGAVNTVVFARRPAPRAQHRRLGLPARLHRRPPGRAHSIAWCVLGAGGAGAAVAYALLTLGARRLTVVDVEPERAAELAQTLSAIRRAGAPRGAARRARGAPARRRRPRPRDPDRHGRPSRAALPARAGCTAGCGSPRSSTARSRPSSCARPARARLPHPRRRRAWPCSRPRRRSSSSPARASTAGGCCATSPRWPARTTLAASAGGRAMSPTAAGAAASRPSR